jgi:hypothetical protein
MIGGRSFPARHAGGADRWHPLALMEGATENAAVVQALSTTCLRAGLIRQCRGCSSLTVRRHCRVRSGAVSDA